MSEEEQRLFRALSVFAGGCTLDAAEEVAGADLDTLQSLVEKSLLRFTDERFWMLETIREYAAERLHNECEDSEILERHARWYLRLAKSAHGELRGPSQADWLERLHAELENLRGAIRWAQEHDDSLEVELAGATWYFLSLRGLLREALGYLEQAIETANNAPSLDQSELLYGGAYVALRTGDYAAVGRWGEQRLELGRARGDASVIARSLVSVALAAELQDNDLGRAKTLYGEAAQVARDCGDTRSLGIALSNLGNIAVSEDDLETARLYYQQGLELHGELSDAHGEAGSLASLANLELVEGDFDEAAALLAESVRIASSLGARELIHICLVSLADVAAQRGEAVRAARLLGAADALREEIGLFRSPDRFDQEQLMRITKVLDDNDPALVAAQFEGGAMTLDEAIELALSPIDSSPTPAEQAPPR